MKSKKTWKRLLSVLLTVSIVITTIAPSTAVSAAENSSTEISVSTQDDDSTPKTTVSSDDVETSNADKTEDAQETSKASLEQSQSQQADNDKTEDASTKAATDTNLYQNGSICIYNEQQLKAIGTETQVHGGDTSADTFGTGAALTDEDGNTLTYAVDGSYTLMNDIPLTKESIWTLPEGFTGSISSYEERTETSVYDEKTDTIYLYNRYQLALLCSDNCENELVMSEDYNAETVGMGQVITLADDSHLTYSKNHNYVLTSNFSIEEVELIASTMAEDSSKPYPSNYEGRQYFGEVVRKIGDKNYILIGNKKQLEAIGTDVEVTEPIWKVYQTRENGFHSWSDSEDSAYPSTLYYPGDADLVEFSDTYNWAKTELYAESNGNHKLGDHEKLNGITLADATKCYYYCGSKLGENGELTYDSTTEKAINIGPSGEKYTNTANYIIFRDIYLTSDGTADGETQEWNPIENFTGTMEGRLNMEEGVNATIHNVTINQGSAIDQGDNSEYGVGFFRNLSTPYDSALSFSETPIIISNITLDNVQVTTSTTEIDGGFSLLGIVLKATLKILGLDSGLEDDPKSFATGALVGVVKGNVSIKDCNVTDLKGISNSNNWTGGLIGYCSGITKYDALSGLAGGVVLALSELLNAIPLLGLGDLVTVLLGGGVLTVKNLIPIGYTNATVSGCSVNYADSAQITGNTYTGGLVGQAVGAIMSNCKVSTSGTNKVNGTEYVGGFTGEASNAVVSGALSSVGINLVNFPANTVILDSDIVGDGTINVEASAEEDDTGYAGGFAGSMGNSYAVDCDINNLGTVSGHDYVGGFAGKATLGDIADIEENRGLLELVQQLLSGILTGDGNAQLLSLVGLRPSVITGSHIGGTDITISATGNYAGGMVGYAGAVQISNTNELSYNSEDEDSNPETTKNFKRILDKNGLTYECKDVANQLKATTSLKVTGKLNVGGVLGKGTMTSVSDVLSGTITAADYIRFELKDVTVDGGTSGMEVTATGSDSYAGGVIGQGIGGEIQNITASNLKTVTGSLGAGGFAGTFGSGRLADVGGGIDLLGLGLLEIDGLLSVADMIKTFANNSSISGVESGLSIKATSESGKAGGFIGYCVSGQTTNCSVDKLKEVTANISDGKAGGFIGYAKAGDALASVGDKIENDKLPGGIDIENLLGVISALTPEFDQSTVAFVSNGENPQVEADMAGGFLGDGEAVNINYSINHPSEGESANASTEISGLSNVKGYTYAGGFAGRVQPGDVAQTGSIDLLGLLEVDQLLSVMDVAYPQISNSSITGEDLIVIAEGKTGNVAVGDAGGYIGSGKAVTVENSNISNVKQVSGAYHAGGYIGLMKSGTVAEAGDETGALLNSVLGAVLNVQQLAGVLQMASSQIINSKVSGIEAGMTVKADCRSDNSKANSSAMAGGFVGEMQSGIVNNEANKTGEQKGTAVENLLRVEGLRYAGGFGGLVKSGSVAEIGENTAILNGIVLNDLISLINSFVPVIQNASVRSVASGFSVHVTGIDTEDDTNDSNAGSAGGFIGYGSGVQISYSDVDKLCNTTVKEPSDLQSTDGTSYFGNESDYSVKGYRNAGGYFGKVNAGSTAAIGGANIFKKLINLGSLVSALNVTISTIEHSDVYGAVGGFNVIANNSSGNIGKAGGFAGNALGSSIQNCNVDNFAHIIGRESAGGYAGTIEPSSAADLLGDVNVLSGLISADNLVGVLRTFVPIIKNSETTSVPCGGVVRADAESSDAIKRGLAGGYVGYNLGGQIKGNDGEDSTIAKECAVIRIRSVYGTEYAGGYTGLMESANVADTGSLKLLYGLIKLDNPLTAVQAIYATEENTAVYGPLTYVDVNDWNGWVTYVGSKGPYADEFAGKTFDDQSELDKFLKDYAYGYDVTAGRNSVATESVQGGAAGGYVGRMEGGTITSATAEGLKSVNAFRSSGGFAGEMITGDVAEVGEIELAGINISGSLPVLQTFVPVIKNSTVNGYQSGAMIKSQGTAKADPAGIAGGYVGRMIGGQIWGTEGDECSVTGLRQVDGTSYAGGYAGKIDPGSAATVDTASNQGLLNKVLKYLIGTDGSLAEVLNATVSTIRYAKVSAWNEYGIVVNAGENSEAAGGFAGAIQGAVLGENAENNKNDGEVKRVIEFQVNGIRSVTGGKHAGGFFGLADVASVAEISGEGKTTILSLIKTGSIDLLDAFRTYIYNADVIGSTDGLTVTALKGEQQGSGESIVYTGNAGGFGGSLLNGSVKGSSVTNLKSVKAPNYTGGFIGHGGKSGTVDADGTTIEGLLGVDAGVLDVFGSNIDKCSVAGLEEGYTVQSTNGTEEIAGGFIGNADLSRMSTNTAEKLKQVYSDEIAGGFVGKTSMAYLISANVDSPLVDTILQVVNELIKALYIDDLQESDLVDINLPGLLKVELFNDGKTLGVTLLGLKITVALSKAAEEGETDVAIITIGDSEIRLNCTKDGGIVDSNAENTIANSGGLEINLIKANRTKIENSSVTGIPVGYDVFGGGASNDKDGISDKGYAGGFAGYNHAGLLEENHMIKADTVRGTANKIGEFSGYTNTDTSYDALKDPTNIEKANTYQVHRTTDQRLTVVKKGDIVISRVVNTLSDQSGTIGEICHTINHLETIDSHNEWQDVYMTTNTKTSYVKVPIKVYVSDAQADLMYGVETYIPTGDETAKPGEMQDPCDETVNITIQKVWKDNDNSVGEDHKRPTSITVELYQNGTLYKNDPEHSKGKYEITGDTSSNVWSITIPELPAVYEENGTYKNYTYTVKEVESQEEYITEYTKDENGYNYVITNTHTSTLVETDSVVIDFGLPVKVNVLKNDAIKEAGTLGGISNVPLNNGNIYDVTTDNNANKNEVVGKFGTATVEDVKNGIISYQLTTMQMESFDQFTYSVETKANTINGEGGDGCYIYSTLTIIPATTIYYEDNASMITYTNADGTIAIEANEETLTEDGKKTVPIEMKPDDPEFGKWYLSKTDEPELSQDTDRPGIAKPGVEQLEEDLNSIYGYDTHYTTSDSENKSKIKYSNGSTHVVEVAKNKPAEVSFIFKGTGFDIISLTDKDTGRLIVKIEKGTMNGNKFTAQSIIKEWIVDTYYGYEYDTTTGDWEIDPSKGESSLYQVPIICENGLEYGTYQVTITPKYSALFDHNKKQDTRASYDFYLDAVRIYESVDIESTENVIIEAYKADEEYRPEYREIRDIVIEAGKFEEPSTNVYIDGLDSADWDLYKSAGPSHELYLDSEQKIAVTLYATEIPESVRIGVKSIKDSVTFTTGFSVNEPGKWEEYMVTPMKCNTATDLYYDITDQCIWEPINENELTEESESTDGSESVGEDKPKYKYKTTYPVTITNTSKAEKGKSVLSLTQLKFVMGETAQ